MKNTHGARSAWTAGLSAPNGTFACPICGRDTPHPHTKKVQDAYLEDQLRNDGWTSTAKRLPKESGWYLCLGVVVPRGQYGTSSDSQLDWFLWVRDGGARDVETKVPEVLYFNHTEGSWRLRNLLGNATLSGAENRWRVQADPRYWRDIPALGDAAMALNAGNKPPQVGLD